LNSAPSLAQKDESPAKTRFKSIKNLREVDLIMYEYRWFESPNVVDLWRRYGAAEHDNGLDHWTKNKHQLEQDLSR